MGNTIPGNGHPVVTWVYGPDAHGLRIAHATGIANNSFSPMARGVHAAPDAASWGYTGLQGYGVNRFAGELPYPMQNFRGATQPITTPKSRRLGIGTGTSGQPGLPSTGQDASGLAPIAWLGYGQVGFGMGG